MFSQEYLKHYRQTLNLAYPIILGQLSHMVIITTDNIVVGNYNKDALAAASLANSVNIVFLLAGLGITMGITPLVATAHAAKRYRECHKLFRHGHILYLLISLVLCFCIYTASLFLPLLNDKPHLTALAEPFLQLIALSVIPGLMYQYFKQFMEGLSSPREPMYIAIAGEVCNIVLNLILVFGWWFVPAMGLVGSGLATLIAKLLMCAGIMLLFYRMEKFAPYSKGRLLMRFSRRIFTRLLKMGMPVGMQMVFEAAAFACTTFMVGMLQTAPLAAHQIALNISGITFMVASGIGTATSIRTANQKGLRDSHRLQMAGKSGIVMVALFMGLCSLLVLSMRFLLPTYYVKDAAEQEVAATLLMMVAIYQLSDGIQVVAIGALRGVQDVKIPTIITLFAYWLVGIPLSYVMGFVFDFGAAGIWSGLIISLTVAALLLTIRFLKKSKEMII